MCATPMVNPTATGGPKYEFAMDNSDARMRSSRHADCMRIPWPLLVLGLFLTGCIGTPPSASIAAPTTPSGAAACSVARDGASGGTLQACPGGGAIGTVVVIEGRGCSYPNSDPTIVFGPGYDEAGVATGTFGGAQLPPMRADANGAFRVEFTIPASLEPHQGAGGGPTMPGRYQFGSKPAFCVVPFTVVR